MTAVRPEMHGIRRDELHHACPGPHLTSRFWRWPAITASRSRCSKEIRPQRRGCPKFKALFTRQGATASGLTDARPGLMDNLFGADVLPKLSQDAIWTGRLIEVTGSRPIGFEADPGLAAYIASWQPGQVAKVLVWSHPDDDAALIEQNRQLQRLQADCRAAGIEWMLELVLAGHGPQRRNPGRGVVQAYENGLRPDWWKLPGWRAGTVGVPWPRPSNRPIHCRGVIVLGLNEEILKPADTLLAGQADLLGRWGAASLGMPPKHGLQDRLAMRTPSKTWLRAIGSAAMRI